MAQFFLKIAHLSFSIGPTPIVKMAVSYGLHPQLWLLVKLMTSLKPAIARALILFEIYRGALCASPPPSGSETQKKSPGRIGLTLGRPWEGGRGGWVGRLMPFPHKISVAVRISLRHILTEVWRVSVAKVTRYDVISGWWSSQF